MLYSQLLHNRRRSESVDWAAGVQRGDAERRQGRSCSLPFVTQRPRTKCNKGRLSEGKGDDLAFWPLSGKEGIVPPPPLRLAAWSVSAPTRSSSSALQGQPGALFPQPAPADPCCATPALRWPLHVPVPCSTSARPPPTHRLEAPAKQNVTKQKEKKGFVLAFSNCEVRMTEPGRRLQCKSACSHNASATAARKLMKQSLRAPAALFFCCCCFFSSQLLRMTSCFRHC